MTIRRRLTLLYTVLLFGALLLFSVGVYTMLRFSLLQQVDQLLLSREVRVRTELLFNAGRLQGLSSEQMQQYLATLGQTDPLSFPGQFIIVHDPISGLTIGQNSEATLLDPPLTAGEGVELETIVVKGTPVRVLHSTVPSGNQSTPYTISIVQSLVTVQQAMNRLAIVLGGGTALLTMLGWWLGGQMAQRALRPIGEMSNRAHQLVESHDLDTRLPVVNPDDELGQLALTFNEALEQIALLLAAQRRFVADAAHELRTPLTSIQGYIELLERGAIDDPEVRDEALDVIGAESRRLTRLVNDLLLLIQSEVQPLEILREPVALLPLVQAVMTQAKIVGPEYHWQLKVGAEPEIIGDRDRLHQLLLNLLDNARRYSPTGSSIVVRLDATAEAACIEVEDEGPGIPDSQLEHLFEPFFRGPAARQQGQGTGLGLAIVARVAAAHGGQVRVETAAGGGSCFMVELPRSMEEA